MSTAIALAQAWSAKGERAADEIEHLKTGGALFRTERVQELIDQVETAKAHLTYWQGQVASDLAQMARAQAAAAGESSDA